TMGTEGPFEDVRAEQDDRALVARAQTGDRRALEELVGRHQAWIYNIAIRMLGHPQDAEDATQEILIKALTRLSSFGRRRGARALSHRRTPRAQHETRSLRAGHGRVRVLRARPRQHSGPRPPGSAERAGRRAATRGRGADQLHLRHAALSRSGTATRLRPRRD